MGKNLVKQNTTFCQTKTFSSPSRVGPSRETVAKLIAWHNSSSSSHVLYMWFFRRLLLASQSQNPLVQLLKLDSSPISHTYPLQLNPHTYRENDWRNYDQIWHGIKANTIDGDQGTASKDLVQVPIRPVTRAEQRSSRMYSTDSSKSYGLKQTHGGPLSMIHVGNKNRHLDSGFRRIQSRLRIGMKYFGSI